MATIDLTQGRVEDAALSQHVHGNARTGCSEATSHGNPVTPRLSQNEFRQERGDGNGQNRSGECHDASSRSNVLQCRQIHFQTSSCHYCNSKTRPTLPNQTHASGIGIQSRHSGPSTVPPLRQCILLTATLSSNSVDRRRRPIKSVPKTSTALETTLDTCSGRRIGVML